jgi:mannose-6-phosphate isomerase-like protein (cupin superfamily)
VQVIDHEGQASEEWRAGVVTRMEVSAVTGSVQLCVFEQWCQADRGAPTHLHAVEEVLTVLSGEALVWVEDERSTVRTGQSVIVPAGRKHGFKNAGADVLHVRAILAAPIFEASFDDQREVSRRWVPGVPAVG